MRLFTIKQLAEAHPGFTEPAIRDDVFHAPRNGLAEFHAIVRKGRRVYLDEEQYLAWLLAGAQKRDTQAA